MSDTIREDICTFQKVVFSMFPCNLQIARNVQGDKAELLLDIIHNEGLIYNIDCAVGHQFLQVIRQRFSTEIEPLDPVVEREILKNGSTVSEGEAAIDDEAALSPGSDAARVSAGLVEVDEGGGVRDVERSEAEVLEDELKEWAADGGDGEGEGGLGEEEGGGGEGGVAGGGEAEGAEEVGPYVALEVGVDEVAAVGGATEREGGGVRGSDLVGDEELFGGSDVGGGGGRGGGGRGRAGSAVGDNGGGMTFAGEANFDEAAAVVKDDDGGRHWIWHDDYAKRSFRFFCTPVSRP